MLDDLLFLGTPCSMERSSLIPILQTSHPALDPETGNQEIEKPKNRKMQVGIGASRNHLLDSQGSQTQTLGTPHILVVTRHARKSFQILVTTHGLPTGIRVSKPQPRSAAFVYSPSLFKMQIIKIHRTKQNKKKTHYPSSLHIANSTGKINKLFSAPLEKCCHLETSE